jgi:hypothetical protein
MTLNDVFLFYAEGAQKYDRGTQLNDVGAQLNDGGPRLSLYGRGAWLYNPMILMDTTFYSKFKLIKTLQFLI